MILGCEASVFGVKVFELNVGRSRPWYVTAFGIQLAG